MNRVFPKVILICLTLILPPGVWAQRATSEVNQIVQKGTASFTHTVTPGMKLPPRKIFQTDNVVGKMQTSDWWSSLAWEPFSSNQFPHPLAVQATEGGLLVSYPGTAIHAVPKHIMASMGRDLTLGHSHCKKFPDARVNGFSDWFVDVLFAEGNRTMRLSYGHGSPFVFAMFQKGGAAILFDGPVRVWAGSTETAMLGITVAGRHYGLFGPSGSTWSGLGSRIFVNDPHGKPHFSLAVLPDDRPETLAFFARYAYSHVVDTRVSWRYSPNTAQVRTEFQFKTVAREGKARGTLFAMYPHQWMTTEDKLLTHTYQSIRGPMRLAAGSGFATTMRFPGILPALPDVGKYDRDRLQSYIEAAASTALPDPPDTYWQGKSLGKITNLIPIAEQIADEDSEVAEKLRGVIKDRLEKWFTAPTTPNDKKERYFYYDNTWGTLIGQRPSYGSAEQLNDHHFHYGYFIRAAAEIARTDKAWAATDRWGGMVELLIRDIASPNRADRQFPFLRCFDPYAGHSWASGHAKFADGNNQESSSEAMNAWTGLVLWGEATDNRQVRDLGVFLYTTELYAANAYWFDVNGKLFPKEFEPTCAALVWGGKTDYATWFSAEPEHTHGIVLLPIQPGSLYLGLYPEYVQRNLACLARLRGKPEWKHWHDTLWCYEALTNADTAMRRFKAASARIEALSRPFVYHWIGSMQTLGHVDRNVTANCPMAVTFVRKGKRTHVAYNMADRPITVSFSDGTTLRVEPSCWAIDRNATTSFSAAPGKQAFRKEKLKKD